MDAAVERQFLDFFQDFIRICQLEYWPDNNTSESEIKNSLLISKHIEKCIDKLQKKNLFNEFLLSLSDIEDTYSSLLKSCFSDPPKYILKKIINSKSKISQMDVGIRNFLEIFSAQKLEDCLAEIMLEAASIETLIKNIPLVVPNDKLLEFKSKVFLSELSSSYNSKDVLKDILNEPNQDTINVLVFSLSISDPCFDVAKTDIKISFVNKMMKKSHDDKEFWKFLLNVEEKLFIAMCLTCEEIFKLIANALIDFCKLLIQNMSTEFFYIDLTYSKLVIIVRKLCGDNNLKLEFFEIVTECNSDVTFWEQMLQ